MGEPSAVQSRAATQPAGASTIVWVARSDDGLVFQDSGTLPVAHAGSPSVVELGNRGLLAIVYRYPQPASSVRELVSLHSEDGGETWSKPQRVRVLDKRGEQVFVSNARVLAKGPDGRVRLYMASPEPGPGLRPSSTLPASAPARGWAIRSAVTHDGVEFRVDGTTELAGAADKAVRLAAIEDDRRIELYAWAFDATEPNPRKANSGSWRFVSSDGRRFKPQGVAGVIRSVAADSIVVIGEGYRAYVSGDNGVGSLMSAHGATWKCDKGPRIMAGREASVIRLKNGSFVMLYCASANRARTESRPSMGTMTESGRISGRQGQAAAVVLDDEDVHPGDEAGGGEQTAGALDEAQQAPADEAFGQLPTPPRPDFVNPVNYVQWFKQQFPPDGENNAYDAYAAFMPNFSPDGPEPEWWPRPFVNGFYNGKPGPWLPEEHPDWEAAHQALEWPLSAFRDASMLPNFAMPLILSASGETIPESEQMLVSLLLPGLAPCRMMAKAALADGWRAPGGAVNGDRMLEGWKAVLGNARQLSGGPFLIGELVSVAEKNLVQQHARQALARDVFQSAEQLEKALNTLKEYDAGFGGEPKWMTGELAAELDVTQYLFSPAGPDGQPKLNVERVAKMFADGGSSLSEEDRARCATIGPEEAYNAIEVFENHHRQMAEYYRIGYPQVKAKDMEAMQMKYVERSEVARYMLPSLARAYTLTTRMEASRRATQLTYEVHLFKARTGYWPASLDELPLPAGDASRTDPFSGGDFGYRLTESGPTIYSLSENGRDDGGVHSRNWADGVENETDSDDFVFWPVRE